MNSRADLLIVTATKVESAAVIQALEAVKKRTNEAETIGDQTYRNFGVVNDCKIFMVQTEPGSVGVGAALQTVSEGIKDLSPSAVIMVGIAFGFNSEKQRIGDILVSKQVRPYEQRRIGTKDGKPHIISRGPRPDASANLLKFFRTADHTWGGQPVTFGVVVSGEPLVDWLEFRQSLLEIEPEAIGGEMESAGLYAACQEAKVDWILVKAICDWADGNKAEDKEARQKLAAENAAAFLVHALRHARLPARRRSPSFWPVVWVGLTVLFTVVLALTVFRRQFGTLHGDTQQINRKVDAVYDKITSSPVVGLPWMEIRTQAGLSGPTQGGGITGEMVQTYRQHSLLLRNTNRFDLRNFSARLQLPENVLSDIPASIGPLVVKKSPNVRIRWVPEGMNWVVVASGEGAGVKQMGRGAGKAEWQLAIDVIPAFEEIELPFLTARPRQDVLPIGLTDTNTMQLENYLLGNYQYSTPDGWKTQQVVMPILFDPANRAISSMPPENTMTNWKSVSRRMSTDF